MHLRLVRPCTHVRYPTRLVIVGRFKSDSTHTIGVEFGSRIVTVGGKQVQRIFKHAHQSTHATFKDALHGGSSRSAGSRSSCRYGTPPGRSEPPYSCNPYGESLLQL